MNSLSNQSVQEIVFKIILSDYAATDTLVQIIIGLIPTESRLSCPYRHMWPDQENIKPFADNMQVLRISFLSD